MPLQYSMDCGWHDPTPSLNVSWCGLQQCKSYRMELHPNSKRPPSALAGKALATRSGESFLCWKPRPPIGNKEARQKLFKLPRIACKEKADTDGGLSTDGSGRAPAAVQNQP